MTELSSEQQDQVVNSFDVSQKNSSGRPPQVPQQWHQKHASKIKTGALLGVIAVLTYVFSGFLLNLRIINADSVVMGASAGDIIGTVYTDEAQTTPIGANKTVALSINGAAKTTVETNDLGQYTFTSSPLNAGDVVSVFLDDETEKASFVFLAQGASYMEDVTLVTNNVKVAHFNAGPITNSSLDTADNIADEDLRVSVSSGTATFADGMKLWVRVEKTYTPGGNVVCDDIRILGTATFGANSLTVSGSFLNSGTMTISSGSSVTFDSTSQETINAGSSNLGNINFNGVGGQWTLSGTLTAEYLHLRRGTVTGSADVTVRSGDVTSSAGENGVINMTGGTFTVYSSGVMDHFATWTFNNLTLGNGTDGAETDKQTGYQLNINGVLTIAATHTYHTHSGNIYLAGNGSPFVINGSFNPGSSTFILSGTNTQNIPATTFNNLTTQNASAGGIVFAGSVTTNGAFTDTTASSKVTFNSGSTYNFNSISINGGTKTTRVVLTSSAAGSAWNLNITAGSPSASYVDVKDSNANKDIDALTGGKDSTGNTHWLFPEYKTVSGTVYSNNDKTSNIGANKTISLSINGGEVENVETNDSGFYTFTEVEVPENGVLAMFVNDEAEKGSIVIRTGLVDTTYINLEWYAGNVKPTFGADTDISEITNASMDIADNVGDSDIGFSYSGGTVTYNDGIILYVWTNKAYRPDGAVIADDVEIDGTLSMEENNLTVSGSFVNAGSFSTSSGVSFDSTATGNVLTSAGAGFGVLTFDGSGGEWTAQDDLNASSLAILNGKLIDNGKNINIAGSISISSADNSLVSTGNWTQSASGNLSNYNSGNKFNILEISASVNSTRTSVVNTRKLIMRQNSKMLMSDGNNTINIQTPNANDFVDLESGADIIGNELRISYPQDGLTQKAINISANLALGYGLSKTIVMSGDWTAANISIYGTSDSDSEAESMILNTNGNSLHATGSLILGLDNSEYPEGFRGKVLLSSGSHVITGSLDVANANSRTWGYFDLGSSSLSVGGSIRLERATIVPGSSTLTLNGVGQQDFTNPNSQRFNNLIITNASSNGVIFANGLYLDGTFTNITPSSKMTFKSGAIYNFPAININGGAIGTKISMLSSSSGSRWYFTVPSGTPTVSYVEVRDSSAVAGNTINARTGCTDLGSNINWDFGVVVSTPTPSPSPTPEPSIEASPSPEASSTSTTARSRTATPTVSATTSTIISGISKTPVIYPSSTATISDIGNDLLTNPEVASGQAIILVASGKAVVVGEDQEIKLYDSTPEFKGVTEPEALVEAEIVGRVSLSKTTTADQVGTWFVQVSDKLPTGKYFLNLKFTKDGKILGSKSYRFEIGRNYWLDGLYIALMLAILAALITLPSRIKKARLKNSTK